MGVGNFGPQGANATTRQPSDSNNIYGVGVQTWVKDATSAMSNDGTVLDAAFFNRIIGALEYVVNMSEVSSLLGDDSVLYRAILAIAASAVPANESAQAIEKVIEGELAQVEELAAEVQADAATALLGNAGASVGGAVPRTISFTVTSSGQTVMLDRRAGSWSALYVNGLRQDPTSYTVNGSVLTLSVLSANVGDFCVFDFVPA